MAVRGTDGDILQKSIRPYIIINGEKHEMQQHPDGNNVFVYDHYFNNIGKIPYYFELVYEINRNGSYREKVAKSALFYTNITNKYIFALDNNRGPTGAQVSIVGCGLNRGDRVRFGNKIVPSNWLSSGAIEFTVPSVECDQEYEVHLLSNRNELFAGSFFVDVSTLHCSTDFIHLDHGESQRLVFMLDNPAPAEGLAVNVTTDIPDNVIMPEVTFMGGERTASVNITGGEEPAKGTLFISARGFSSLEIPIEVGNPTEVNNNYHPAPTRPSEAITTQSIDNDIVVL